MWLKVKQARKKSLIKMMNSKKREIKRGKCCATDDSPMAHKNVFSLCSAINGQRLVAIITKHKIYDVIKVAAWKSTQNFYRF